MLSDWCYKVNTFVQNKYGLNNIVGNVWEWVFDSWEIDHYVEV